MSNTKKKRPTETLATANGFTVVMNKWVTVRELDDIARPFTRGDFAASIDAKNETADLKGSDTASLADAAEESKKIAIEHVVVSISDGEETTTEDLFDYIQDMPSEDGTQIFDAIEYITNPKKKQSVESPFVSMPATEESPESSSS